MTNPRTTLAQGFQRLGDTPPTPATTMPTAKKPKQAAVYAIPASLQITDDPLPASRAAPVHKYHSVFDQMKYGQCVRCTTADVGKVAGGLRKYLEVKNKPGLVRTMTQYTNDAGHGRVWLLPVALKQAA